MLCTVMYGQGTFGIERLYWGDLRADNLYLLFSLLRSWPFVAKYRFI